MRTVTFSAFAATLERTLTALEATARFIYLSTAAAAAAPPLSIHLATQSQRAHPFARV